MDACIGKLLHRNMYVGSTQVMGVEELIASASQIAKVLRNEYLLRDPRGFPETVYHRIGVLAAQKELI